MKSRSMNWLTYRGGLYLWAMLFVCLWYCIRFRNARELLILVPVILQVATLLAFPLVQDARFTWPVVVIAPAVIAFLLARTRDAGHRQAAR